jgi:hypothetical protein
MELFRWLRWQWRQWEFWQKCFIFAMFCMGISAGSSRPYDLYFASVGVTIFFGWTFKWWVLDPIKESYTKYKRQRDELFNTIKGE